MPYLYIEEMNDVALTPGSLKVDFGGEIVARQKIVVNNVTTTSSVLNSQTNFVRLTPTDAMYWDSGENPYADENSSLLGAFNTVILPISYPHRIAARLYESFNTAAEREREMIGQLKKIHEKLLLINMHLQLLTDQELKASDIDNQQT